MEDVLAIQVASAEKSGAEGDPMSDEDITVDDVLERLGFERRSR